MAKELFINSVRQLRIQGHTVVPTVVYYKEKKCLTGFDAINNCDKPADLREDFKVEIGSDDPYKLSQQRTLIGGDVNRSTIGIAKDFIDSTINQALALIERQGFERPSRILVAEPLSLAYNNISHDDWLKNYRGSIKRILTGRFAEIDFMPEPFAVFQYYRYGIRHALVAQKQKHIALVFDFGGGTFDLSVIETTAAGDISKSGRNSKPLAARSIPVCGFALNRMIAEKLLFKVLEKSVDRSAVRKALEAFSTLKNLDDDALATHRSDHAAFARNYRRLLQSVEQAKLIVCSGINKWSLDADLSSSPACSVDVPQSPLRDESIFVPVRLEAREIRAIYESDIWKQKLLPIIKETLRKAESELGGKQISIVLLSGGTSNIRWLKPLMERDLGTHLRNAEILELSENFQEIVSKGLAVECARRFYTEGDGDFRAITYNRLCLGLNPNSNGLELKKFIPESYELDNIETDIGVLLPSSTSLKGLIGKPLRWKVRLAKAPNQTLDYYFMRSSFDPEEMNARHNIDFRVITPRDSSFGASIGVELIVREDGTAEPSFIYGKGLQSGKNTVVKGRPFYMDMTFASEEAGGDTYLGFDFGTSSSSLCYVDASDIKVYADRANDRTWMSLSVLIDVVPYPAAYPLARFLSETSADQMDKWGREAFEGMLSLVSYIAYAEHCSILSSKGGVFKGFRQRSAGPLWGMFKRCAEGTGKKWEFGKELLILLNESSLKEIDAAVSQVAQAKHGKRPQDLDYPRILEKFGNAIAKAMNGRIFGYFEDARRKAFNMKAFQGIFRNARGSAPPFIDIYQYEGPEYFPAEFVFMFDLESGKGLPLFPFIVRGLDKIQSHHEEPDFFMYDITKAGDKQIGYKAIQERDEVTCSKDGVFPELFECISIFLRCDEPVKIIEGISLTPRSI